MIKIAKNTVRFFIRFIVFFVIPVYSFTFGAKVDSLLNLVTMSITLILAIAGVMLLIIYAIGTLSDDTELNYTIPIPFYKWWEERHKLKQEREQTKLAIDNIKIQLGEELMKPTPNEDYISLKIKQLEVLENQQ